MALKETNRSMFLFRTSLHCAAANNSIEMCQFLISHGACVFAVTAIEGKTPSRCCEKESQNFEQCFDYLSGKDTQISLRTHILDVGE